MGELLTFEPTKSAHIRNLTYNPDDKSLKVTFASGGTYTHSGVPAHVFAAMTRHPSAGKYYHSVIKVHYPMHKPEKHGT